MKSFPFKIKRGVPLVVIKSTVNNANLKFAIDTGASHSVIDKSAFLLADGELSHVIPSVFFETASGKVKAEAGLIHTFSALGQIRKVYPIYVYYFFTIGLITEIDGMLGLDFFAGKKLCIDFRTSTITLS